MPRLFVAVRIPVTPPIVELHARLQHIRGLKPVAPANMHYTIRFMGDVAAPTTQAIKRAFETGTLDVAPFDAQMQGVSAFPNVRAPRVVWIGTDGAGTQGLARVAAAVDGFVDEAGLGSRDKPFVAHLTVARVRRDAGRGLAELTPIMNEHRDTHFGGLLVQHASLVASTLTPQGPVYEDLCEVALQ